MIVAKTKLKKIPDKCLKCKFCIHTSEYKSNVENYVIFNIPVDAALLLELKCHMFIMKQNETGNSLNVRVVH